MASIVVSCETCGQRFKAPESAVGKRVKCTFCEGEIVIQAAGDAELSMAGFIDLSDDPPEEEEEEEERRAPAPKRKPAGELPRRGQQRRTKTKARTRDRETLFDLSADDVPRRRPRPAAGGGGGGRPKRGNTGMRRRPEPEPVRGGGGGGRSGGSSKKPLNPMVLVAAGGGGLLLLILIVVGMSVSSANKKEARKKEKAKQAQIDLDKREKERKAARRAELKTRFKAAKSKADDMWDKEEKEWQQVRADKRAKGITVDEEEKFRSPGAAKAFVDAARAADDAGEAGIAKRYYNKAIVADPENKPARIALGHKRWSKPTGDEVDELAMEGLLEELDAAHDSWFDKEGFAAMEAKAARLIAEAKAEMDRRRNDPIYKVVQQVKRNIRSMEILKDIDWKDSYAAPYLIFEQQKPGQEGEDPAAAARLKNKLAILQHLYGYFGEKWAKPFGLTRDESKPLKILVMRDEKAFDEYNAKAGVGAPPGVIAYYETRNKWVVLYNGIRTGDPNHTAIQKEEYNDGVTFHEGTHQLVDAYVNKTRTGMRERIGRSRWLDEGMCEYIGAVKVIKKPGGEKTWKLEQRHDHRVEELHDWINPESNPLVKMIQRSYKMAQQQQPGLPDLPPAPPIFLSLSEMVSSYSYRHVTMHLARKYGNTPYGGPLARAGTSIVYAQSVQFWHFCMNHENGKYKQPMMEYLKWEWGLRPGAPAPTDPRSGGGQCLRAFQMIFKDVDLKQLELEYWQYVDKLIKEVKGPKAGVPQALFDKIK
ncbi:MAG: hypothetical protein ACYTGX_00225 [Planctomycetota bacterium]